MRESELLSHIFGRSADLGAVYPHVEVGPGDDCAVVRTASGERLLLKVDQVVEGRHFSPETPVDLIARKAMARAVSDIAAMAGTPAWGLCAAVLPAGYKHADKLFDRMAFWAREFGAPLVGGDISSGDAGSALMLGVTVGGSVHPKRGAVLRSGARAGDEVWVTGRIGGSLASGRHLRFTPRVAEARRLADALGDDLHAMIDLSDGLGRDSGRVAERSGVRVVIEGASVPLHEGVKSVEAATGDGEDYELLFVVSAGAMGWVGIEAALAGWTRIGRVEAGSGCVIVLGDGKKIEAGGLGWDH